MIAFVVGRILNRFSKDIGMIDDMMPMILCDVLQVKVIESTLCGLTQGWIEKKKCKMFSKFCS